MAYTIPETEPGEILAGDSLKWTKGLTDYPASTWTLTYHLFPRAGTGGKISITASADGENHSVSVVPATTADYLAGEYRWHSSVSDGTDRYNVAEGDLTIRPDPAVEATIDSRTFWRTVLDDLNGAYLRLAAQTITSASVNGRSYTLKDSGALRADIGHAQAQVRAETDALNSANGRKSGRTVSIRFLNAR